MTSLSTNTGPASEDDAPQREPLRHPLVELYLAELSRRRPTAVHPVAEQLDDFFHSVGRDPPDVTVLDVLAFATGRSDEPSLVSQLRNVSRFYHLMLSNGALPAMPHPVPARLSDRRSRRRPVQKAPEPAGRSWPLLGLATRRALLATSGCARDRAILLAFLFGGLRLGEVVGLRLDDLNPVEEHIVVTGHGGSRRIVPIVTSFFTAVEEYLTGERPGDPATPFLFVSIRGRHRGAPLSADGVQDIVSRIRSRAGAPPFTPSDLRLACLGALRAVGMSNETLRAFAGHRPSPGLAGVSEPRMIDEYRAAAQVLQAAFSDAPVEAQRQPPLSF